MRLFRSRKRYQNPYSHNAFDRFKADPTGLNADNQLRVTFRSVDAIRDPKKRNSVARHFANELLTVLENIGPKNKSRITAIIGNQLREPSSVGNMLGRVVEESSKPDKKSTVVQQRRVNSINSFVNDLNEFLEENPQITRKGKLELEIDEGKVKKFRVAPPTLPPGIQPKWISMIRKYFIYVPIFLAITSIAWLVNKSSPETKNITPKQTTEKPKKKKLDPSQERITPDNPVVLQAVGRAIKRKNQPLNLSQIFDCYDYVSRKIKYLNVSHDYIPRWPEATIKAGFGDCKSMSVVLASMLEAIGGKTIIIDWFDPIKKTGHEYIGILVSNEADDKIRRRTKRKVKRKIIKRYWYYIRRHHSKMPKIHMQDIIINGEKQSYLLLDPTFGRFSIPGEADPKFSLETIMESRPGINGIIPKLN